MYVMYLQYQFVYHIVMGRHWLASYSSPMQHFEYFVKSGVAGTHLKWPHINFKSLQVLRPLFWKKNIFVFSGQKYAWTVKCRNVLEPRGVVATEIL